MLAEDAFEEAVFVAEKIGLLEVGLESAASPFLQESPVVMTLMLLSDAVLSL